MAIAFIKQVSCKSSIMEFYWKVQKLRFTRIFISLLEFQLIRINIIVVTFKFIIIESENIQK